MEASREIGLGDSASRRDVHCHQALRGTGQRTRSTEGDCRQWTRLGVCLEFAHVRIGAGHLEQRDRARLGERVRRERTLYGQNPVDNPADLACASGRHDAPRRVCGKAGSLDSDSEIPSRRKRFIRDSPGALRDGHPASRMSATRGHLARCCGFSSRMAPARSRTHDDPAASIPRPSSRFRNDPQQPHPSGTTRTRPNPRLEEAVPCT